MKPGVMGLSLPFKSSVEADIILASSGEPDNIPADWLKSSVCAFLGSSGESHHAEAFAKLCGPPRHHWLFKTCDCLPSS
jgi:hypothetical protein